jgi:hypothetical protein
MAGVGIMAASNARKRTLRDIWPHLVVSACALLLPPLGMAAGVVYLGSSHPQETAVSTTAEQAAPIALAAEPTQPADPTPALASTAAVSTSPTPAAQRPAPEPQLAAAPAPAPTAAPMPASTKDTGSKDVAAKDVAPSAAPVAKIGETSEPTARAEASPTEAADAPAAPAANAQQNAAGLKQRHDSRGGRVRQARIPSITDIFGVHRYR